MNEQRRNNGDGLPKGWAEAQLKELARPRAERVSPAATPGFRFIALEHVEARTMRLLDTVPANQMKSSAAQFRAGDVLYGRLRPYLNKVVRPDFDGLSSAEFIVFPDTPQLRSSFLQYRLNAADFVSFASHLNEGDRPRVDFDQIGNFTIHLPPEPEQRRIIAKIEELFSDLDAGMAALERVRLNLNRYRAAVLKAAVEGRLTEKWRQEHPPAEPASKLLERILIERRKKWEQDQLAKYTAAGKLPPKNWREAYQEPAAPDTANLPDLPVGWCWATAAQLADATRDITYGVIKLGADVTDGVPTLRTSDVRHLRLDLRNVKRVGPEIASEYSRTLLRGGEVVVAVRGTLGGVVYVPPECAGYNISREVAMLAPLDSFKIGKFVAYAIGSEPLQHWLLRRTRGIAYTGINIETLTTARSGVSCRS